MTTTTLEQVKQVKIELPKYGMFKDKDGKSVYGMLPYEYTFDSKESYLAWKQLWKTTYKELTTEIREAKKIRGTHGHEKQSYMSYRAAILRIHARTYMEILEGAKKLSWEQKQKASATCN